MELMVAIGLPSKMPAIPATPEIIAEMSEPVAAVLSAEASAR
jgi:hypothetical protein